MKFAFGGILSLASVLAVACGGAPADASSISRADFDRGVVRVQTLLDAVAKQPGAAPAMSVVMVWDGGRSVVRTTGRAAANVDQAAEVDTPFYIASQTKSFVGLLAVKLDALGVFDLDQTLTDVWPDLSLPDGSDPGRLTFRDLLSHQEPFRAPLLLWRTNQISPIPAGDMERLLEQAAVPREPGFRYDNLGYLIYAAALELKTGRDWRDALHDEVFVPLGMTHSGARPSRLQTLARPHQWLSDAGWAVLDGKADGQMHAAGGLYVSPDDMARWLFLQTGRPAGGFTESMIDASHRRLVAIPEGANSGGIDGCDGYALGWAVCPFGATEIRVHGGSFAGSRSIMAASRDLGVGFAFMANSDSLTGGLGDDLTRAFFEAVLDLPERVSAAAFAEDYGRRVTRFSERRLSDARSARADPMWNGWLWTPDASALSVYGGRYVHPVLGEAIVDVREGAARFTLGAGEGELEPASPDMFAVAGNPVSPPEPVRFEGAAGTPVALIYGGERFERMD